MQEDPSEIDQLRTNADNLAKCLHALLQRIESLEVKRANGEVEQLASPKSPRSDVDFKDEQATIEDNIEVDPVTGLRKRRIVTERVLTTKTFHQLALDSGPIPLSPMANGRLLSPVYQSRAVSIDRRQLDQLEVAVSNGQVVVLNVHPSSNHDIHPGDTILQVNGQEVTTKEDLFNTKGPLEITLVPSELHLAPSNYYRMLEDYNSESDPSGCRWLPVDFKKGDVIQAIADDGVWKQARKVNDLSRVGYLPSYLSMEKICMLAPYGRRILVLLGAPGVGRRTLKKLLLRTAPHHFDTVVPLTSRRPRKGEIDGVNYTFKRREDMYGLIREGRMVEWGELDGELYGTSTDSIREIIRGGRMCVTDCSAQALHYLYNKEFMPFVVHIAPPPLEELIQLEHLRHSRRPADKLAEICSQADGIASGSFGTKIHATFINRNIDVTFKRLIDALENLRLDTQWVPQEWMS